MQMPLTREITLVAIISHWSLAMRTPLILQLVLTEKESKKDTRPPESKRKCPRPSPRRNGKSGNYDHHCPLHFPPGWPLLLTWDSNMLDGQKQSVWKEVSAQWNRAEKRHGGAKHAVGRNICHGIPWLRRKWSDQEECHSKNRRAWCDSSHRIALLSQCIQAWPDRKENNSSPMKVPSFWFLLSTVSWWFWNPSQTESVCSCVIKPVWRLSC